MFAFAVVVILFNFISVVYPFSNHVLFVSEGLCNFCFTHHLVIIPIIICMLLLRLNVEIDIYRKIKKKDVSSNPNILSVEEKTRVRA